MAEKFSEEYEAYCRRVPMVFGNLICVFKVLLRPVELSQS